MSCSKDLLMKELSLEELGEVSGGLDFFDIGTYSPYHFANSIDGKLPKQKDPLNSHRRTSSFGFR